jgi:hypothetical protein
MVRGGSSVTIWGGGTRQQIAIGWNSVGILETRIDNIYSIYTSLLVECPSNDRSHSLTTVVWYLSRSWLRLCQNSGDSFNSCQLCQHIGNTHSQHWLYILVVLGGGSVKITDALINKLLLAETLSEYWGHSSTIFMSFGAQIKYRSHALTTAPWYLNRSWRELHQYIGDTHSQIVVGWSYAGMSETFINICHVIYNSPLAELMSTNRSHSLTTVIWYLNCSWLRLCQKIGDTH